MSAFTATEGSTQPIVLGKEPVEKPKIYRGDYGMDEEMPHTMHPDGTVTFDFTEMAAVDLQAESDRKFRVTYHRAKIRGVTGRTIYLTVDRETVVTWERLAS